MATPLVTIRCLVYNHEPYLRQCLDGFVMQKTNFPFEAIVHDDASTDRSAEIIREYAEKYPNIIKPIFETENQYSKKDGSLRRMVDKHIRGKYIAMCEGDDYWIDPYKLQKQVDYLENNPEYTLSYTNFIIDDSCHKKKRKRRFKCITGDTCEYLLTKGNPIGTLTVCIRNDIYFAFSQEYYTWNIKMKMGDLPLWIYATMKGPAYYIPEVTAAYRVLPQSASHNPDPHIVENFIQNATDICLFFNKKFKLGYSEKKIWRKHYRTLLLRMCEYPRVKISKYIKECLIKSPCSLLNMKVCFYIVRNVLTKS